MFAVAALLAAGDVALPTWSLYGIGGVLFALIATGTMVVPAYWWRMERADRQAAEERERATYRESTEKLLTAIGELKLAVQAFRDASEMALRAGRGT